MTAVRLGQSYSATSTAAVENIRHNNFDFAELKIANAQKSPRRIRPIPLNGKDDQGYTFRPGLGHGFPFSLKANVPHPNTKEPKVQIPPMSESKLQELRRTAIKGHVAAEAAKYAGYPLAGKLLAHYLSNAGTPLVISLPKSGFISRGSSLHATGLQDQNQRQVHPYDPAAPERIMLQSRVTQYFRDNPTVTEVTASSDWTPQRAGPLRSDHHFSLNSFYDIIRGQFIAQRDSKGNVVSIKGEIQYLVYDHYDFTPDGYFKIEIPVLGDVQRNDLAFMAHPKVGLAKGFDIWIKGPVMQVKLHPK